MPRCSIYGLTSLSREIGEQDTRPKLSQMHSKNNPRQMPGQNLKRKHHRKCSLDTSPQELG